MKSLNKPKNTLDDDHNISLIAKILLIFGGSIASIFIVLTLGLSFNLSVKSCLVGGLLFAIGALAASQTQQAAMRYACSTPCYITGMILLGTGILGNGGSVAFTYILLSLFALPAFYFAGDRVLRHLAIAQFFWLSPLWLGFHNYIGYQLFLVIAALVIYSLSVVSEDKLLRHPLTALHLSALRLVLLLLIIGLMLWIDYGFFSLFHHASGIMSLVVALLLLAATFWAADRVGFTLSILFLIYALWLFYYNTDITLLGKSLLLMANGVLFIALFFYLKRQFK